MWGSYQYGVIRDLLWYYFFIIPRSDYYPFGTRTGTYAAAADADGRWRFSGKEWQAEPAGLQLLDFGARMYDPATAVWLSQDPMAEKYPSLSPYSYCAGDPVNLVDPDGMNPVYSPNGIFWGTDDTGLQGSPYIISKDKFTQGMPHSEAEGYSSSSMLSPFAAIMMLSHYGSLKDRPDYDGYVTISEGVKWAKNHPNAKNNPTPDNTLYVDAANLDFGIIGLDDMKGVGEPSPVDLFKDANLKASVFNARLRSTVYAFGRINLILLDKEMRTVKIVNDEAAVYDWNYGGSKKRNDALRINNTIFGINPDIHGFNVYYYGIGRLNK